MVRFWVLLSGSWDIFYSYSWKKCSEGRVFRWRRCFRTVSYGVLQSVYLAWSEPKRFISHLIFLCEAFFKSVCGCRDCSWCLCAAVGFQTGVRRPSPRVAVVGRNARRQKCSRQKATCCSLSRSRLTWAAFRFVLGDLAWVIRGRLFFLVVLFSTWWCLKPCMRWVAFCTWTVRVLSPWEKTAQRCVRHGKGRPGCCQLKLSAGLAHDRVTFSWNLASPQRQGQRADFWMKALN